MSAPRCAAPVGHVHRETYAARVAGAARAARVRADMQHSVSYDASSAADRAYERAYAQALRAVDDGGALCGEAATTSRVVERLVVALCERHAAELDRDRAAEKSTR